MKKNVSKRFLAALLIVTMLSVGCATKEEPQADVSVFRDVALKEGEILPGKDQLKQERAKIVVLETEDRFASENGRESGEVFANTVEQELNETASEVVDRTLSHRLSNELKLAELNGTGGYKGPQVAQYAIRGQINSVEYVVTKSAQLISRIFKNKDELPVRFDHKVNVEGAIKIYEIPSLRLITAINVKGSASEDDSETGENKATRAALLKTAINYAISDQSHEIKNFFAPKGYVVERRSNGEQSMFKVLLGREQGAKPGDYVAIYSPRMKETDAFSLKGQMEEVLVAEGTLDDSVGDTVSWVVVDDMDTSVKVRLGDYVKVRYQENSIVTKILR